VASEPSERVKPSAAEDMENSQVCHELVDSGSSRIVKWGVFFYDAYANRHARPDSIQQVRCFEIRYAPPVTLHMDLSQGCMFTLHGTVRYDVDLCWTAQHMEPRRRRQTPRPGACSTLTLICRKRVDGEGGVKLSGSAVDDTVLYREWILSRRWQLGPVMLSNTSAISFFKPPHHPAAASQSTLSAAT